MRVCHDSRWDRRQFMQTSAFAALGFAALPSALAADEGKKDDPYGGFTLGVQSYTFRHFDREQALKRTQELGLHHIEFYQKHAPLDSTPEQVKAILSMCKEYAIAPNAWGVQAFTKNHDANKRIFHFGKSLGVQAMSADPDPDSFDSLDKLCDEYKIAIAIHPHGPQGKNLHRWYSAEVILAAIKGRHRLIGTCLDTGHLIRMAQLGEMLDPVKQVHVMGKRNFGMHLKDHDNKRKTDVIYGQDGGVLDVPAVLKALKEEKFGGYVAIEYEAKENEPTADVKELVKIVAESAKKVA